MKTKRKRSPSFSPKSPILGYEPYINEYIDINKWINEKENNQNNDNIVISYDSQNICLKRSYFINIDINNLILECIFKNNALMLREMYENSPDYLLLKRYGFNNNYVIDLSQLQKMITENPQQTHFFLKKTEETEFFTGINKLAVIHNPRTYEKTESYKYIEKRTNTEKYKKINFLAPNNYGIPEKYIKSLNNYTYHWDKVFNGYLRRGEYYFEYKNSYFAKNMHYFGENKTEAIENIKNGITLIDMAFHEMPKTQTGGKTILFRGIRTQENKIFDGLQNSYLSTTTNIDEACNFAGNNGFIYQLYLDPGIPYLHMSSLSHFPGEDEILLPRGLVLNYLRSSSYSEPCNKMKIENVKVLSFSVHLQDKYLYNEKNVCKKYKKLEIDFQKTPTPTSPPRKKLKSMNETRKSRPLD